MMWTRLIPNERMRLIFADEAKARTTPLMGDRACTAPVVRLTERPAEDALAWTLANAQGIVGVSTRGYGYAYADRDEIDRWLAFERTNSPDKGSWRIVTLGPA